jgi:hypothetical protein
MRTWLLLGWLLVPVGFGAYHYGPGQEKLRIDDVSQVLAEADHQASVDDWAGAAKLYEDAIGNLPADHLAEVRRIRLERDKAWMNAKKLPEANADLTALVAELQSDPKADPKVLTGARQAMANAQYYTTWLMKLEGLGRDEWEPQIESARQLYRLLAEQADNKDDAASSREDLESTIRLARMEPGDLQGWSIPKQCQNCKSGQCKKPGIKPGKQPKKDSRGAGSGLPPDGSGS